MIQTVLALISVLAAGIAFSQVYLMRTTAHGELLYEVMRIQGEQAYRDDRARVYTLARKPFECWTPDEYQCVARVATRLDQVGFLVKHRYVTMRAFSTWHTQLALCYQITEPLITYRRTSERMPSLYLHFEWLARRSLREPAGVSRPPRTGRTPTVTRVTGHRPGSTTPLAPPTP